MPNLLFINGLPGTPPPPPVSIPGYKLDYVPKTAMRSAAWPIDLVTSDHACKLLLAPSTN
jgi:hypothetical protein